MSESNNEEVVLPTEPEMQADPIGVSQTFIKMYQQPFRERLKELSTGQLRRLSAALVLHPLEDHGEMEDKTDRFLQETYVLGMNLMECQFILRTWVLSNRSSNAQSGVESPSDGQTENVNQSNNEGETNG